MNWKNGLWPARGLRNFGLLGMNQRNGDYISRYNPRRFYPKVDDKCLTKSLAMDAGIAVPQVYAMIEIEHQIGNLGSILADYDEFVIKPAHGSGGEGILIINGRNNKGLFRKLNGVLLTENEIAHHISNILSGMYSLGGQADKALIEYRVEFSPVFEHISYQGVPDIRTIVFRGVPVMAMVRLPTRLSDGKANLHQGAIGVGINLETGKTLQGVSCEEIVTHHHDTGHPITDIEIPDWDQILALAASCQELVSLGYIGVDIVLDANLGPLMLEINARPGLSIQIANQRGLLPLLKQVEKIKHLPSTAADRVFLGQQLHAYAANPRWDDGLQKAQGNLPIRSTQ